METMSVRSAPTGETNLPPTPASSSCSIWKLLLSLFSFGQRSGQYVNEHLAAKITPMSAAAHSLIIQREWQYIYCPWIIQRTVASLSQHKLCTQNPAPRMEESMLSVCLLYAKLAKVLMTYAQGNSLRHQENSPLALDQTYTATVHMVF